MSDTKTTGLTPEQLKIVAGGDCTIKDLEDALARLQETYESLIDFTSYVIGRVAGP